VKEKEQIVKWEEERKNEGKRKLSNTWGAILGPMKLNWYLF
jgi:hypothetical protein